MDLPDADTAQPLYLLFMLGVVVLDAALPVIPSELMVIGSGTMASHGTLPLPATFAVVLLGSWLGDLALFTLFRNRLTHWLDRFRWGRWMHLKIRDGVARAGTSPTFAGLVVLRLLPGGRTASVAAAGIAELGFRPFLVATAGGAVLWAAWLVGLGYATGAATELPTWFSALLGMTVGTLVGLVTASVIAINRRRKAPKDR